jgi:histone deacetylase 8
VFVYLIYFQDCPPFVGLPEYVQLIAGASLTAANALKQDKADVAICWDGGRFGLSHWHDFVQLKMVLDTMHRNPMHLDFAM